jgi:hypothetical protein
MFSEKKGSLTLAKTGLALRILSLTAAAIFLRVPRTEDIGLESTEIKAP